MKIDAKNAPNIRTHATLLGGGLENLDWEDLSPTEIQLSVWSSARAELLIGLAKEQLDAANYLAEEPNRSTTERELLHKQARDYEAIRFTLAIIAGVDLDLPTQ